MCTEYVCRSSSRSAIYALQLHVLNTLATRPLTEVDTEAVAVILRTLHSSVLVVKGVECLWKVPQMGSFVLNVMGCDGTTG